jgi:hypothetical protein
VAGFRQALVDGLRRALRQPQLLLPLYLCGLLLGLVQTWPLLVALGNGALYNPFLGELATGGGDALANLFLGDPVAPGSAALWGLLALPLTALFSLAYNVFSGGILSIYTGRRRFWDGCRHNCWSFMALGALLLLLVVLVVVASALLATLFGGRVGLIFALLALQIIGALGEYARAIAVVYDRRNPFVLLARAFSFFVRHLGGALLFALLGLLIYGGLALLYTLAAGPLAQLAVALLLWQQLALLAGIGLKLLRLAWAVSYVHSAERVPTAPETTSNAPIVVS